MQSDGLMCQIFCLLLLEHPETFSCMKRIYVEYIIVL